MLRKLLASLAVVAVMLGSTAAQAALITFTVSLTGAQEVPVPGDPDGSGTAVLTFDSLANSVAWEITVADIDLPLTGAHIHNAAAGLAGPVVINFNAQLSGGLLVDSDVAAVLASPTDYYVNLHNSVYPAGAIRGQLGRPSSVVPEPGTLALLGLGLAGIAVWRRRRH